MQRSVDTNYLLSTFGAATATGLSAMLKGEVSHDRITRFLSEQEYTPPGLVAARQIDGDLLNALYHLYVLLGLQHLLVGLFGANHGTRFGVDHVWLVLLAALALMPLLYFSCRTFARLKRTSNQAWVRYF